MVLYEVNLTVDTGIADAYATWLHAHINEILAIDGFESAEWYEVESDEADGRKRWSVQYRLRDRESLERYFAEHASRLRQEGIDRFGERFSATRRILTLHDRFKQH